LPERTRLALEDFGRRRAMPYRFTHDDMFGGLARARELCAQIINADVREIALATNTTFGLASAAGALPLKSGDKVLVSDREFPANVYPWLRLKEQGIEAELVPTTAEGWPDEERLLQRLADPKVRVLAVSITQFSTGYTVDLDRLSAETRRLGKWLVVDAIQGIGHLALDLRRTQVDLLACGGQKWLLSPWGSGFVYARKELIPEFRPPMSGWMAFEGTDDLTQLTRYNPVLRTDARRFEMVTLPFQDFFGMGVSLELLLSLGVPNIERHVRGLHRPVMEWAERRGVKISSPVGARSSGILCLTVPRVVEAHEALRAAAIYASLREGAIRLAPHCYNTLDEMAWVADVLDRAL
jgi:selenocysteine lyase/cysteine desulfurase